MACTACVSSQRRREVATQCAAHCGSLESGTCAREREYIIHHASMLTLWQVQATASDAGLKFLLICGKPIGEPIVQYGPFVMNSDLEIRQVRCARCGCCVNGL